MTMTMTIMMEIGIVHPPFYFLKVSKIILGHFPFLQLWFVNSFKASEAIRPDFKRVNQNYWGWLFSFWDEKADVGLFFPQVWRTGARQGSGGLKSCARELCRNSPKIDSTRLRWETKNNESEHNDDNYDQIMTIINMITMISDNYIKFISREYITIFGMPIIWRYNILWADLEFVATGGRVNFFVRCVNFSRKQRSSHIFCKFTHT